MVERGWAVVGAGGDVVGQVAEVIGEPEADIFDGLAVSGGPLGRRRYVPAEVVGEITTGTVKLTVDADELEEVERRVEPPGGAV